MIMADDENCDLLVQLQDKTEELRMWYQNIYKEDRPEDPGSIFISPYEKKMLDSCYRWHINSHIRLDIFRTKSSLKSYFLLYSIKSWGTLIFYLCELKPHAIFQNPRTTLSRRKITK